ncbi:MAG: hypothetical protein ACLFWF_12075, partial [Alphaproteobacteria bacterium]
MPRDPKDVIQVVSPPDQAVINVIRDCFEARIVSKASISVAPLTNTSIKTLDDLDKIAASLVDLSTKNIRHARIITTHNVRCDFDRGVTRDGQLIPALYEAEFFLNVPQGQQTDENVARQVANAITRHCGTVSNKIQLGSSALSSAIASHVESLASVAARVSEQLADAQIAYDKKLQNHLEHLERKVQEQDKSR